MTFNTLESLREDPRFREASFREQQELMLAFMGKKFQDDERMAALEPGQKQLLIDRVLETPPTLADPEADAAVKGSYARYQQGDQGIQKKMISFVGQHAFMSQSILANVAGRLAAPVLEPMVKEDTAVDDMLEVIGSRDFGKTAEYYNYLLSKDQQAARKASLVSTAAGIGGFLVDMVPLYALGAGATVQKARGLGKVMVNLAEKSLGRLKGDLGRLALSGAKEVGHALATTTLGVARENVLDVLANRMPQDADFSEVALRNWDYFKGYFLGDVAANLAFGVAWPMVKGVGKSVFLGKYDPEKLLKNVSGEDLSKLVADTVSGNTPSKEIYDRLDGASKEVVDAATAVGKLNRQGVHAMSKDELFTAVAASKNFVAQKVDDVKWRLRHFAEPDTWKTVGNMGEAEDLIAKHLNNVQSVAGDIDSAAVVGLGRLEVEEILKGTVGKEANVEILTNMLAPRRGEFDIGGVRNFSKALARSEGASKQMLKDIVVEEVEGAFVVSAKEKYLGTVPKTVGTGRDEREALRSLVKGINEYTSGLQGAKPLGKELLEGAYERELGAQRIYSPAWVDDAAKRIGGEVEKINDSIVLRFGGDELSFKSYDEAGDALVRATTTPEHLQQHLQLNRGLELKSTPNGGYQVRKLKGKKVLAEADSFDNLLAQNPDLLPKPSSTLGPKFSIIDNEAVELRYTNNSSVGNYRDTLKHLDNFQKLDLNLQRVELAEGNTLEISQGVKKTVEVHAPDVGYRRRFSSVKEAKEWLNEGKDTYTELQKIALTKGYRLQSLGKQFVLYGENGQMITAPTTDAVKKVLADTPHPKWAAELSGLDEDMVKGSGVQLPEMNEQPLDYVIENKLKDKGIVSGVRSLWRKVYQHIETPEGVMTRAVERGDDPQVLKHFRSIKTAKRYADAEHARSVRTIEEMFKGVKKDRRIAIRNWLEAPADKKTAIDLSHDELQKAEALREAYRVFAEKFDVDPDILLQNYIPHIRKNIQQRPSAFYSNASDFLDKAFEGKPPASLDAFFEHQRLESLIKSNMVEDPVAQFNYYSQIGHRKRFVGPAFEEAVAYMKANRGKIGTDLERRFNIYLADSMGIPAGVSEELLAEGTAKFWQSMGVTKNTSNSIVSAMLQWTYFSSMAFRPWLAVRNAHQIWTTLAMRVGNDNVRNAVEEIANDGGPLFERYRRIGVFQEHLPVHAGETLEAGNLLARVTKRGLKNYKRSDEFTRAVAYRATENRFDAALKKWQDGVDSYDQFLHASGISRVPRDLQVEAEQLLKAGKIEGARDVVAKEMVDETMFDYSAGGKPLLFRSTVGKLFGTFGRYPIYYIENFRKAMRYTTTSEKVASLATVGANSLALYGIFNELMGINASSFLPQSPLSFSGGPLFEMMVQGAALPGLLAGDYRARQSAAELLGVGTRDGKLYFDPMDTEFARLGIPLFARKMHDAVKYFNEGKDYYGFLSLSSAPINPKWLEEGVESPLDVLR